MKPEQHSVATAGTEVATADFQLPVTGDRLAVYFSVAGRPMLFDAGNGAFAGSLNPRLQQLLDDVGEAGAWNDGLREHWFGDAPVPEQSQQFLRDWLMRDSPQMAPLETPLAPTHFIVFPAAACNMACGYCCNDQGQFNGQHDAGVLAPADTRRFLDWLESEPWADVPGNISMLIVGGEPTLNPEVCRMLVEGFARLDAQSDRRFSVKIATNGLQVPESLVDCVQTHNAVASFGVSIDGAKDRHDANRVDHKGRGTFDAVKDFLKGQQRRSMRYSVTAVLPYPYEFSKVYKELRELGADKIELKGADFTPHNTAWSEDRDYRREFAVWRENYLAYNDLMLREMAAGRPGTLDRRNLAREIFGPYREEGVDSLSCDAGLRQVGLSPDGYLYPCDRFFGNPSMRVGSMKQGGAPIDVVALARYQGLLRAQGRISSEHPNCRQCMARAICRGGCYGNNLATSGRIDAIADAGCERRREMLRIDLWFLAKLAEEAPEAFEQIGGRHHGR